MPASIDPVVRLAAMPPLSRSASIALVLLFALIWFANLDYRRLVHPDEGRYAEIAREMVVSGDWVTPRLNGIKYFEKPPLQYWLTAAAYEAFGIHEWTARLWPALAGFARRAVHRLRRTAPRRSARWACTRRRRSADASGTSLNAHILTLDSGLTFWMSVGFGALLLAQRARRQRREQRSWMLVAWAALALARRCRRD